ncbi:hypothetical protein MUP01_10075 [Candidatus Bathyarchaeota archaeon]|nr:hypothetical protein [Candidatus Bathyarchaeota archaeon]
MAKERALTYVRYRDHVLYHRSNPESQSPQIRETVGWLVYEGEEYITICWDRDADPPTLKGGDPKASGLVLLRGDILEMKRLV